MSPSSCLVSGLKSKWYGASGNRKGTIDPGCECLGEKHCLFHSSSMLSINGIEIELDNNT